MNGLMMDQPLLVKSIVEHAQLIHPDVEVVSVTADNPRHRYTYREAFRRSRQLANVMAGWGLQQGDRVATLGWSDHRHLEAYYAICTSGYVCHTINPRLFLPQLEFIINHAEDQWVFVDRDFLPLAEALAPLCPEVRGWVVMTSADFMPETSLPDVYCYEPLLADASDSFRYPQLDENSACSLCYTSGTTGNPKGVLYSHRSTILHTLVSMLPNVMNLGGHEVVLPIVPMFHVNAWGFPYSSPLAGAKLVLPGSKMGDGRELTGLINSEGVTLSAGVPTVWLALQAHLRASGESVPSLKRILTGGSAPPLAILEEFDRLGVESQVAWGMTEMSPLGTANAPTLLSPEQTTEAASKTRLKAGRQVFGVELKITGDDGEELPWDGEAFGNLKARGPWVCSSYFRLEESSAHAEPGWLDTGDIATIDPDGLMAITDRSKDVIKSGGEWISSIDVENAVLSHPKVAEAAVIGRPHPRWGERPLLIVVRDRGAEELGADEVLDFLRDKVAKWWLPDAVEFVDELPHTATGKIHKVGLRETFAEFEF
ncbi:MAG: long-chain fatty acid--CoA ligase [Halieaceae bacterium]|nr:long-chain fatty acid--CoA ligase [Halieaceae bacterium]